MAIKRYTADADTTITNAFEANLVLRGTGSNMGAADSLAVFSIYGQTSSSAGQSSEESRILIQFPVQDIIADRAANILPDPGSVSFYLKMFNAKHPFTLARDFTLTVSPISQSWQEGSGLDMDEYKDLTYNGIGSNWIRHGSTGPWTAAGGDYLSTPSYDVDFPNGWEDLTLDISTVVEDWIAGTYTSGNCGVGVQLSSSLAGASQSYYLKKFFARSSEFFYKRPVIEARWDSRVQDDRCAFYYSSSLAPAADNLNTLYFYNYIRGRLVDYGGNLGVSFYSSSAGAPAGSALLTAFPGATTVNAAHISTGIYGVTMALTAAATPLAAINDVWRDVDSGEELITGSFSPEIFPVYQSAPTFNYVTALTNLKANYSREETARFRFFIRQRNWDPNMYVVATNTIPNECIASASYKIMRLTDELDVVSYGTGSDLSTYMSYDVDGNYFDLDMSLLEADYMYGIKLAYYNDSIGSWVEQPEIFKFRIEE
jgi:hypothetical protein